MKKFINCEFNADLKNVIVSRGIIASFFMDEDVNINIINEVKTIVSEAVTNAIIHGYKNGEGIVGLNIDYDNNVLKIEVIDKGVGIENIEEARTPLFSTGSKQDLVVQLWIFSQISLRYFQRLMKEPKWL